MIPFPEVAADLSPTQRLLCALARCADATDSGPGAAVAALALQPVNWTALPELLLRHGLHALAISRLAPVRDAMPATVWQEIHAQANADRVAALVMAAELMRVLRACREAGINALPYKGPLLGWEAYGDLGARPSIDLDLLIRPGDFDSASAVLGTLGYRAGYRFTRARDRWFRRVDGDYPFEREESGDLVELHLRAMSRRFGAEPTTVELWSRRRDVTVAGSVVTVLGASDTLYLQLVHGAKHRWERLEWIAAAAALLRACGGNATLLCTPTYPNRRAVLLGCLLARVLCGAPVDEDTARRMTRDPAVVRLAGEAIRHLFRNAGGDDGGTADTAAKVRFNFHLQSGAVQRVRFGYRWLAWPSPEDWEWVSLPDPLFFAYRLIRPARLTWRYARPGSARGERPAGG